MTAEGIALSVIECGSCHTRLLPDGKLLYGAPFNEPLPPVIGELLRRADEQFFRGDSPGMALYRQFGVPWVKPDVHEGLKTIEPAEIDELFRPIPPGAFARFNGSPFYPTKVPDLIEFRDRKYIDIPGLTGIAASAI